ncbi:NST1 [Candida margitis]|uniref:NST1 n=1 Tax=Candida margitis TaxID=1775924 RepID=UPI002225F96A|nr:NST1 [Candida margitis]KAI5955427.1 NST1 [Candida margitis]
MSSRIDSSNSNTKFKVGDNVHFEVSNGNTSTTSNNIPNGNKSSNSQTGNATNSLPKSAHQVRESTHDSNPLANKANKKKKKGKGKKTTRLSTSHAHLNKPEDDYPTSRVIKQAPNGDVIVESLDDEDSEGSSEGSAPSRSENGSEKLDKVSSHHPHSHPHSHNEPLHNQPHMAGTMHSTRRSGQDAHNSLWDSASIEEQEKLKQFWESLAEPQKLELVKIDKESIMKMFKNETRQHLQQLSQSQSNSNSSNSGNNSSGQNNCTCKYCGRRNNLIEEELESIYDNHFDDIIDFIHEVRDINDLNALPGLLFGGFHMLEEERKLQKRKQLHNENLEMAKNQVAESEAHIDEIKSQMNKLRMASAQDHSEQHQQSRSSPQPQASQQNHSTVRSHPNVQISASIQTSNSSQTQLFDRLLDPKLFQALEGLDLQKMKETAHLDPQNAAHLTMLEKAGSLKEIVRDLHNHDGKRAERGAKYVQNMGKFFSNIANMKASSPEEAEKYMAKQFTEHFGQGLSTFAEDLLNNDGNSFINMMESLTESRSAREDVLKEMPSFKGEGRSSVPPEEQQSRWVDEDDEGKEHLYCSHHHHPHHHHHHHDGEVEDDDEYDYEYEYEEEEEEEEEEEKEDDLEDGEGKDVSDTESEISEEEKMQEIRRLFLIQVIKLFQERLKSAYKEKVSKDNTQKLIEELEAEEKAKKEREAKKLKQKEKAKEKKRLLQLAKEEEKRKKEEEAKRAEEEVKAQQEKQRLEQKRKKEEAKLKREEEKKRKAEEAKKKEEEHRKKVEAQQRKEEEAKKLKEERRKKAEQERKQKEEENQRKERLKKQRDQEAERIRVAREKQLAEGEKDEVNSKRSLNSADAYFEQDLAKRIEEEKSKFFNNPTSGSSSINQPFQQPRSGSLSSRGSAVALKLGQLNPNVATIPQQPPFASDFAHSQYLNQASVLSPQAAPTNLMSSASAVNSSLANTFPTTAAATVSASATTSNPMSPWTDKIGLNNPSVPTFLGDTTSSITPNVSATNIHQQGQPAPRFDPFGTSSEPTEPLAPATNVKSWNTNPNAVNTGGTRSSQIWNMPAGSTPSENPFLNPGLKSNALFPMDVDQNNVSSNGVVPNAVNPHGQPEVELIQSTAFNCFQAMAKLNQLEFGVAPVMKLFEEVKSVTNRPQLTMNQFLSCCQSGTIYQFEKKYDPFGTITHIKVGSHSFTRTSPGAQFFTPGASSFVQPQSQSSYPQQPVFHSQTSFGPGGFPPPGIRKSSSPGFLTDPPLMNLRGEGNPKTSTSGFVDGLWNNV